MEFLKSKVGVGLGIAFIGLFCAIYVAAGYHIVDDYLSANYGDGYERLYIMK